MGEKKTLMKVTQIFMKLRRVSLLGSGGHRHHYPSKNCNTDRRKREIDQEGCAEEKNWKVGYFCGSWLIKQCIGTNVKMPSKKRKSRENVKEFWIQNAFLASEIPLVGKLHDNNCIFWKKKRKRFRIEIVNYTCECCKISHLLYWPNVFLMEWVFYPSEVFMLNVTRILLQIVTHVQRF